MNEKKVLVTYGLIPKCDTFQDKIIIPSQKGYFFNFLRTKTKYEKNGSIARKSFPNIFLDVFLQSQKIDCVP